MSILRWPNLEWKNPSLVDFNRGLPSPKYEGSSHMEDFLSPNTLRRSIHLACQALYGYNFDGIAFRGMSGAMIAAPVAAELYKKMLMVRKERFPDDHSTHLVEGDRSVKRYIILDDFQCTGATREAVVEAVRVFAPEAECLGLLEVQHISPNAFSGSGRESGELYPLR